jgi:hypothetical protein
MPLLSRADKFFYFIHIPKTGGSHVEEMASRGGWKIHMMVRGVNARKLDFLPITPQHFHADLLERIFQFDKGLDAFTIVRHPFARFKSEYYWQKKQGMTTLPPKRWIQSAMVAFREDNSVFDNHLRPQIEFIPQTASTKVFKLEENGIIKSLSLLEVKHKVSILDLLRSGPKRNTSKRSKREEEVEDAFQSKRSLIETFYQDDLKAFGYE